MHTLCPALLPSIVRMPRHTSARAHTGVIRDRVKILALAAMLTAIRNIRVVPRVSRQQQPQQGVNTLARSVEMLALPLGQHTRHRVSLLRPDAFGFTFCELVLDDPSNTGGQALCLAEWQS